MNPNQEPDYQGYESWSGSEESDNACAGTSAGTVLLNAAQAADLLCISENTLRVLVKRDRLPCVEFVATGFQRPIRRYRVQDMIKFIDESVG